MATVSVNLGITKNTGNFENLRLDIRVEEEVRAGEKVTDAIDRVYTLVEKKVDEKLVEALGESKE